jgi:glycerol-3-phosphate acyltransferase PlsY
MTMDWATLIAVALGAYLLGSVPFGLVMARIFGLGDLRQIGSGNIGATNVLRTGNKLAAALTLIGDAGKGAAAVLIARAVAGESAAGIAGSSRCSATSTRSLSAFAAARAWRHSSAPCWRCPSRWGSPPAPHGLWLR